MAATYPFLTSYDPAGTSEGTLDPLGLAQVGEQLANALVPAVRERMLRVRFLTACAVGAMVTEGLAEKPEFRDAAPFLVWEWLVIEAFVRTPEHMSLGVPGTMVARRAVSQQGYLDARSYLKTPRIFGFFGVYKRLAVHLGILDVHLGPGPNAQSLVDAWARGREGDGQESAAALMARWNTAVKRSLGESPPRTQPNWAALRWEELAVAFDPDGMRGHEKRRIREMLHGEDGRSLRAFNSIWALQDEYDDDAFGEEVLHVRLAQLAPEYGPLLEAIRVYEEFARRLQDAFDALRSEASRSSGLGFTVASMRGDGEFRRAVEGLHEHFEAALGALGGSGHETLALQGLFATRFEPFATRMDPGDCALALCLHHEAIQRGKSLEGKRPWFDRVAGDRIFIRPAYRTERRDSELGRYTNAYRGRPIRRFHGDLA